MGQFAREHDGFITGFCTGGFGGDPLKPRRVPAVPAAEDADGAFSEHCF